MKVVSGRILFMPKSEKLHTGNTGNPLEGCGKYSLRLQHAGSQEEFRGTVNSSDCCMGLLWKHEPSIDQDVSVVHPNQHTVHTDLTQAPYWQDPKWRTFARGGPWERSVWLPIEGRTEMFLAITLNEKPVSLPLARLHCSSFFCRNGCKPDDCGGREHSRLRATFSAH